MIKTDFIAKTWKAGNSLVTTIPTEVVQAHKIPEGKLYLITIQEVKTK